MTWTEEWRPVVGYEGLYEVSDRGCVRSKDRYVEWSKGRFSRGGVWVKGQAIRQTLNRQGRANVNLSRNGRSRTRHVHVIVLLAFVGPRPEGMVCRHLDGNPLNNCIENLVWGTPKENSADMIRHGTAMRGDRHPQAKRTVQEVREIRAAHAGGESVASIARRTGIPRPTVRHIVNRYSWRHLDAAEETQP